MIGAIGRLAWTEAKLLVREPMALTFTFALPIIVVLVLGGVFDVDDPAFEGAVPSDYYVAAYLGVVMAAVGLIMLPVHLAAYRERGILRRFEASHLPRWSLPLAHLVVGLGITTVSSAVLLVTSEFAYGVPALESPGRVVVGYLVGAVTFTAIGIFLGSVLPNARSAQGLGLLLFFPMFLLGGAGPPPEAMSDFMQTLSDFDPLTHVIRAILEPWLALGDGVDHLAVVAGLGIAGVALWLVFSARRWRQA